MDIYSLIEKEALDIGDTSVDFFQSNSEGEIIDIIHQAAYPSGVEAKASYDGIIINPGAYSHYSIAIRDAIEAVELPVIEVHISNIYGREEFRRVSVISAVCIGVIGGLGAMGYILALRGLINYIEGVKNNE